MTAVIPLNSRTILGLNQEAYQQLRLTLSLNLRRQLLIAVCDDATLQTELATRLATDVKGAASGLEATAHTPNQAEVPAVVTLGLNPQNPDLARQVVLWCRQHNLTQAQSAQGLPTFQILGIDRLTRHSPSLQNHFLSSLAHLEPLLSRLELRLVLWVSRPWLRKIRQSVPEVWRLRTGLFEFAGDPTPLTPVEGIAAPSPVDQPAAATPPPQVPATTAQIIDFWTVLTEDLSALEATLAPVVEVPPRAGRKATPLADSTTLPAADSADPAGFPIPPWEGLLQADSETGPEPGQAGTDLAPSAEVPPQTAAALDQTTQPPAKSIASPGLAIPSVLIPFTQDLDPREVTAESAAAVPPPQNPAALPASAAADSQLMALWQHIQALARQQAGPLTLARAYLYLGQTCRDRIETNQATPELVDLAIEAYRQALPGLPPGSLEWCDGYNDLGSLYWLRSHHETHPEGMAQWLQQAIAAYRQVLDHPQDPPAQDSLARLYSNLGTVHSLLANLQDPATHLEQSVRAYHQALRYRPAETYPLDYATLQNSLGAIHWRLAQLSDPRHQLHQAITAYHEALQHRTPQNFPQEYAMIQNNLGIAYWNLAQHERPQFLLEQALAAYQAALAYRTLAADPAGCAATHNNLGTAYWDLAQHQGKPGTGQQVLWQQALTAYEAALTAAHRALGQVPPLSLSFDLWATYHSAGVVHDQLAQHLPEDQAEQRGSHLDQALLHYLTALQGWRTLPDRMALLKAALVHNIRLQFQIRGVEGQNAVLSKIPAELLPHILPQL